jgi:ABC-type xylose transport system permease subunit
MLHATVHWIHRGLAWLILAGLVVEFYLAGAPLFRAVTFEPHVELGRVLGVAILVLFLLGLIDRSRGRILRLSTLLVGLMVVQWLLPALGAVVPWVAALHAINAMTLIGVTYRIASALGPARQPRRSLNGRIVNTDTAPSSPMAPSVRAG